MVSYYYSTLFATRGQHHHTNQLLIISQLGGKFDNLKKIEPCCGDSAHDLDICLTALLTAYTQDCDATLLRH